MVKRRRGIWFACSALLASGVLLGVAPATQAGACGTLQAHGVPSCGVLWGISTPDGSAATLRADETQVGRKFDIGYHFHWTGDTLPTADERSEVAEGRLLQVNIESRPYSYADIAGGKADAGLASQARGVTSLHAPVYVTFEHEPDVKTKSTRGTPAQFVAAWRHVHDLFVANGATNVVWVWTVTGWSANFSSYASFYPGNDVVDWVSWDAYSTTSCNPTRNVLTGSFADPVGPMYTWMHDGHAAAAGIDPSKPESISEYGAAYDSGNPGSQGAWYQAIPQQLKTAFPDIKAVTKWDNPGGDCQYQMGASPSSLAGVKAAGQDPYVNQMPLAQQPPVSVSFVGAASTTGNATTESVTIPAAVKAGNGMLLVASGAAAGSFTAPAGWTRVDSATTSSITTTLWRRVATSADPGSQVTVTFGAVYHGSVQLLAYSGTNATNPVVNEAASIAVGTASAYSTPAAAVPANGDVAVSVWSAKSSTVNSWTAPASQSVRSTAYGTGTGRITSLASDSGPLAAGPAGGVTATTDTVASAFVAWTVVLG